MTTTISPTQYCAHPEDYKNYPGIDNTTRAYWDQFCQLQQQLANTPMPNNSDWDKLGTAVLSLLQAIFTPQGMEMLGIIVGGPIAWKTVKGAIGTLIKNGLDQASIETAEKFIAEGGDSIAANSGSILNKLFTNIAYVDVEIAEEVGYSAGRLAVTELVDLAESIGGFIFEAAMTVQLIGFIFDAIDPCSLNQVLDATQLQQFNQQFNTAFRNSVMVSVNSSQDSYGHVTINGIWPIEYYAEQTALIPFKNDYYDVIRQQLFMQYLSTLQYNSNGQLIYHKTGGKLISNSELSNLELSALSFFGNNNTVVENWLIKWWPILVGLLLLILIVLIFLKRQKSLQ